jgi:protein O-GlcNAc transferase
MPFSTTTDLLREAVALQRRGAVEEAAARYGDVLRADPDNADAHYYLGMMACQAGRFDEGVELARKALASGARHPHAHILLGRALGAMGRHDEAIKSLQEAIALAPDLAIAHGHLADVLSDAGRKSEAIHSYDRALALTPDRIEDWFNRGLALHAVGRLEEALGNFEWVIASKPEIVLAYLERANVLFRLHRNEEALASVDGALLRNPDLAEAWHSRGNILCALLQYDGALTAYGKALALKTDLVEGWLGCGNALRQCKRYEEALAAYEKALAREPKITGAWLGRGNVFLQLQKHEEALTAYEKALELKSDLPEAWLGRGIVLKELRRRDEALDAYDKALVFAPDLTEAWLGRGEVLSILKQHELALTAFDRALALKPDSVQAWYGRSTAAQNLYQYDQAFLGYHKALTLDPDLNYAEGFRLAMKLHLCDWTELETEAAQLLARVREGKAASVPFALLPLPSTAADQLQCAQSYVKNFPAHRPIWVGERYSHDRIRVAYLSADFRNHATAQLTVGLFEHHDKSRFEVTGISIGTTDGSPVRRRLESAFEHFVDVKDKNEAEIANLIRNREIDIAVDLMGYAHNWTGILARRAAPIQINFLGYPGTMGADWIDYIIADASIIPEHHFPYYAEHVVWLPDTYQANDNKNPVSERKPTRAECGLPETAFVFCCFNNAYKILPEIFDIWMRLLGARDNSALWLIETNQTAAANLRREAERRGISGHRLIFAPKIPVADHLARSSLADLFIDTLPCNAHTTGRDALWAGVPLVTCLGSTFASRVAASLLKSIGLDELITYSLEEYEALALKLMREPSLLASVKTKLLRNRNTYPLFDTVRFTRHIEAAYFTMWERYQKGQAPKAFAVNRIV